MKHLILLISLLWLSVGSAETVKVISHLGVSNSNGSGWLVQSPMGPLVVTCPHVLIPTGAIEIYVEKSSTAISAKEVWSDWARGISILKLDSLPLIQITDRFDSTDALASATYSRGDKVQVEGFPAAQTGEALHAGGQIAEAQTQHPFLPLADGLLLIGTHAEKGMSCGPVYKQSNHRLIGILSNQAPEVIAGRESKITPIAENKIYENAFAVSAREIAQAINRLVQEGPHSGDFDLLTMPSDDRMKVGYGIFQFTFTEGKERAFKVAGGTGVGVGGVEHRNPGSIEVTLNPKAKEKTIPPHLQLYFDNWKVLLLSGRPVIVDGFVKKDATQGYVRKEFETIEEFVKYLMQPEMIPFGRINQDLKQLARVQKAATELRKMIVELKDLQLNSDENMLLENLLAASSLLSEDYGTSIVKQKDLEVLQETAPGGRFAAEWVELFRTNELAAKSGPMMTKLFELTQLL